MGSAVAETWSGTERSGLPVLGTPEVSPLSRSIRSVYVDSCNAFTALASRWLKVMFGTSGDTFTVEPGTAIDGHGREIQLRESVTVGVPDNTSSPARLVVEYAERGVDPVPVSQDAEREWSRIEEGCRVVLGDDSCAHGVTIARLIRDQNKWRADDAFVPARPR